MLVQSRRTFSATGINLTASLSNLRQMFGFDDRYMYDPPFMIESFQSLVYAMHDLSGFSWPATLLVCGAGFRLITSPIYAKSVMVGRRRSEAAQELAELRGMARDAVFLRDSKLLETVDKEYKARLAAKGLSNNPFQGLGYAAMIQFPWTITMFISIRDMSLHAELFRDFVTNSSMLWCPSLALPDPYGVLPLVSTLMVLRSLHTSSRSSTSVGSSAMDSARLRYVLSGATLTFLPFLMQLPSGVILFFLVNTVFNRLVAPFIVRLSKSSVS